MGFGTMLGLKERYANTFLVPGLMAILKTCMSEAYGVLAFVILGVRASKRCLPVLAELLCSLRFV